MLGNTGSEVKAEPFFCRCVEKPRKPFRFIMRVVDEIQTKIWEYIHMIQSSNWDAMLYTVCADGCHFQLLSGKTKQRKAVFGAMICS